MALKKKIALITDASHPSADPIAKALEKNDIIVIRNYPRIAGDTSTDVSPYSFAFDTWSLADMYELLEIITANIGNVNYLIHTDNLIFRASIADITEDDLKTTLDYNMKSAFVTTKVFVGHMAQNNGGAIVYLSTIHDDKPTGCAFAYSVSKGAVKMLSKEMALFYGRQGIRANLVQLDSIEAQNKSLDSLISPFNYDAQTKIPLRRLAQPDDCAGIVNFLLSDAASFINGAEIRIDGGHLLYYFDR